MRRTTTALALTCATALTGCSVQSDGAASSASSSATSSTAAAPTSSSVTRPRSSAPAATAPAPVRLPAGTTWMPVAQLRTRLAIPTTWRPVDLSALRDQKGTPAFTKAADAMGYTEDELSSFMSSASVAMAYGPQSGQTAPNLLVQPVAGARFTSGDQLTSSSRGASGVLDAQSTPTTPAGPAVRGDFHTISDGLTIHVSQLAVSTEGQQDVITVAAADAPTVKRVMDAVVATYSPQP